MYNKNKNKLNTIIQFQFPINNMISVKYDQSKYYVS